MARLLIVDDNESLRKTIAEQARSLGHDADTARNGLDAIEKHLHERYDIIVSDLLMPVMDGTELLEKLREKDPDVFFVIMSGYVNNSFDAFFREKKVNLILQKGNIRGVVPLVVKEWQMQTGAERPVHEASVAVESLRIPVTLSEEISAAVSKLEGLVTCLLIDLVHNAVVPLATGPGGGISSAQAEQLGNLLRLQHVLGEPLVTQKVPFESFVTTRDLLYYFHALPVSECYVCLVVTRAAEVLGEVKLMLDRIHHE
jgi:CheY-like chemotaxis protein